MKKMLCLYVFAFLICSETLFAQEVLVSNQLRMDITNITLNPYFKALKDGDVDGIRRCISGDVYNRFKILLEQNSEYPNFLRKTYQGAIFSVDRIVEINNKIIAYVSIELPDGHRNHARFLLRKEGGGSLQGGNGGIWKLTKYLRD